MTIDKDFLNEIYDALSEMKNYADDGMCDRNDPEFSEFFESVDNATRILKKLDTILYND